MEKKHLAVAMMVLLLGPFIGYTLHINELETTISDLQTQIDQLNDEDKQVSENINELETRISNLQTQIDQLNDEDKQVSEKDRILEGLPDQIGSGFEDSFERDSNHLGGEKWDTINHYVQVYSTVTAEWDLQTEEKHSGKKALEFAVIDPGTERVQLNLKIWEHFGDEIYVSMWYKFPADWGAKDFYILAELARERPILGLSELALELGFWENPQLNNEWWFVLQKRDLQRDIYINGNKKKYTYYKEYLRPVILGKWFHVEWYLKRHSTNGEVRIWIDGELLADRRNEMTKTQDLYYIAVMRIYTSKDSPFPQYLWGDDLVIRVPKLS